VLTDISESRELFFYYGIYGISISHSCYHIHDNIKSTKNLFFFSSINICKKG
jgi:hypothetical protein